MTGQENDTEKSTPDEIATEELDQAAGDYGRRMPYSYDNNASTHYQAVSSDDRSDS